MTKQEFEKYSELQVKFAEDVDRVTNFLGKINNNLKYVTEYYLEDGTVFTHGWEYWSYGGEEEHHGSFDAEMLTWTDEQLQQYIDKTLAEREAFALAEKKAQEKAKEEKERNEYERLKEKFGK